MSAMEKFFASLRRLLEPRTQPPAESTEQPTADRPPPPSEPAPYRQPDPTPYQELARPDAAPADDVSEVRALLESVAETPVATPEPAAHEQQVQPLLPDPEPMLPDTEPTPLLFEERSPTVPSPANELPAVEESVAHSDGVGGGLVLTLATPAAIFTLARSTATIGRGQENTVRLDDFSVSRRHARIAYRGGGYWLSDLGSMGGTWVDGVKLNAPRRIAAGQVIDIGVCRLTASFAAEPGQGVTRKSASKPRSEEQARRPR